MKLRLAFALGGLVLGGVAVWIYGLFKPTSNGPDSPIVVSDGSTYLRHKGTNHDFHIGIMSGNLQAIVQGAGNNWRLACVSGFPGCAAGLPLTGAWELDIYDATPALIMTIKPDTSGLHQAIATFNGLQFELDEDQDGGSAARGGTKITQSGLTFHRVTYKNNGDPNGTPYDCNNPGHCVIQIQY